MDLDLLIKAEKLRFGVVENLKDADEFFKSIDNKDKSVTVIHIYEYNISGCEAMNGFLITLVKEYPQVKFCKIHDSLGTDFYASDVESFLLERGMIFDRNCVPSITKNSNEKDSD
ncbi:phosducin-like [Venturia canescens]|uniref:phosducin-like n=1 Tax=Venturia canescens TaxID=32260 RepID=UPI001C9C61EC|nr:phosducin-like [Venturia canescens]XP_043278361.1 phosducin-like [Venturia canescens]